MEPGRPIGCPSSPPGLFVVACAVAYGGLFSHAYPGRRRHVRRLRPGARPARPDPLPRLLRRVPAGLGAGLRAAGPDLERALRARLQAADDGLRRRLRRLLGLDRAPARAEPAAARADDPRAGADGAGVPQPLRPRCPRCSPRSRSSRCCAARERSAGALLGAGTAIKLYPAVFVPIALRRVRSLTGAGAAYLITAASSSFRSSRSRRAGSATASRRSSSATCRSRASAPRSCSPARSSGSTTRAGSTASRARSTSAGERPTRSASSSSLLAVALVLVVVVGVLARPRRRRPAGHRLGGGGHRVRRVREGALAAVPDLARPARPARRRAQGPLRGDRLPRRARR